ncbi:hypothetical protein QE394_002865 [Arthrobacter sp. SORGH_AS 212]|uniref:hypothetical protein n=1 Tax=Pseudarthrobacter sp. SORGH_AS 212 TaxID=3041777 RepID=UPI002788649A|nr:hypothetical protein [Arthrobacter sp. SORGH_AS_0212]
MGDVLVSVQQQEEPALVTSSDLLHLQILGVEFVVRWGSGVSREQQLNMRAAWARCASEQVPGAAVPSPPAASEAFAVSVAYQSRQQETDEFELGASSFEELAENLTSRLTVTAILANAGQLTMLHACGIADPETGATVALVAKSGTGKTTAASVLAKTYGYVTDETVAIRHDRTVMPYPKPLSVKLRHGRPKKQVGPDALGLRLAPPNPFLQSIVLLNRVSGEGRTPPALERVPLPEALLALIPDSSSQGELQQPLQSLCRLIDSVGGVWEVTYSEATDLPAVLAPLFQEQPRLEPRWEPRDSGSAEPGEVREGYIQRTPAKDAIAIGSELLVMVDAGIVDLAGIGPAIWEAAAEPLTPGQLAEKVAKVHGTPEGYRAAVEQAVELLAAEGVLEQGRC